MESRIAGVGVVGFRDIRGPVLIGPWAKINLLGGTNNSGKSAILDAIRIAMTDVNLRQAKREGLDVPQVLVDGVAPPFEVAFMLDLSDGPSVGSAFIEAVTKSGRVVPAPQSREVTALLAGPEFTGHDPDGGGRWFWLSPGSPEDVPARQAVGYPDRFDGNAAANRIREGGYSGTLSWGAFALRAVQQSARPGNVIYIPAARRIVATDHRGRNLPATSGEGLPGMLLSMLAPSAEEFHDAKRRLAQINAFLREVLNRETAELLVPHDAQTIHVALEDRVLPLSHLGAGIEQLVLLAAVCTEYENSLILIEEPDLYLHPTLQRQLMHHLQARTSNTYIATTHSAAMLDIDFGNVWSVDWSPAGGTTARLVTTADGRASLAQRLGFRPSDLVQANAVIWVEGPSDRIYLRHLLALENANLVEGVHYSFVLYGGVLGQHLSAADEDKPGSIQEEQLDDFINVTRINRNSVFIMDSDLTSANQPLAQYKARIKREFTEERPGFAWITAGYTIENYLPHDIFVAAYKASHPRKGTPYEGTLNENPFAGGVKQPNKVQIARDACAAISEVPDRGNLRAEVKKLARFLATVNESPALAPVGD